MATASAASSNIARLGRSFLNPVKKMRMSNWRLRPRVAGGVIPTVFYSKDIKEGEVMVLDEDEDVIAPIMEPVIADPATKPLLHQYSIDDIDTPLGNAGEEQPTADLVMDFDLESPCDGEDIVLMSCGILAVTHSRHWRRRKSSPLNKSTDSTPTEDVFLPVGQVDLESSAVARAAVLHGRPQLSTIPAKIRTHSLDNPGQTMRSQIIQSHKKTEFYIPDAEIGNKIQFQNLPIADVDENVPDVAVQQAVTAAVAKDNVDEEVQQKAIPVAIDPDASVIVPKHTSPVAAGGSAEYLEVESTLKHSHSDTDTWPEPATPDQQHSMQLYHPCMKTSFSEGSLSAAFHVNAQEVTLTPSDGKVDTEGSAFSRLRVKMSNLSLPTIPSQTDKRTVLHNLGKANRLNSELRFEQLNTKIILL